MLRLRDQLLLSHMGLTILAVLLTGLFILHQMESFYLGQLQTGLTVEADLIAGRAADALATGLYLPLREALATLDRQTAMRVRVVDAAGRLVAATEAEDAPLLGQRVEAPGLDEALRGEHSVVRADEARGEVLYLVAPVVRDGQVLGAVRLAYTLADVSAEVAGLRRALLIGLAGVALVALLLAELLAANLAAPARRLADAARRLAAGDLSTRARASGSTEIAVAAQAFDEMASRLQRLQRSREELLAAVAHDLHAASMSVGIAIEALEHGASDDPLVREELQRGIRGHTRRLVRLADDLLQTARLETGTLRLERQVVAPALLLAQSAAEFRADATERDVSLAVEAPLDLPGLWADPARLGQALANLVENALRHAPEGSTVRLQAEQVGESIELAVVDSGPGYVAGDPAAPGPLADRADGAPAGVPAEPSGSRPGRLGLGLSIVRGIAEAHGGRLAIDSIPGQGSRFAIVLPVTAALPVEAAVGAGRELSGANDRT